MYYDFSFTIPANTAKKTPEELDVKLTHGVIQRAEISFPAGCAGLVSLTIRHGLHQVWPTNPDGAFNTDGYTIPIDDYYRLFSAPYILTLVGWNLDDTYDHTLEVRFGISESDLAAAAMPFTERIKRILPPWPL